MFPPDAEADFPWPAQTLTDRFAGSFWNFVTGKPGRPAISAAAQLGSVDSLTLPAYPSLATAEQPEACNALESMLSEFVGTKVTKCCDRYDRDRCCFEVARDLGGSAEIQHLMEPPCPYDPGEATLTS